MTEKPVQTIIGPVDRKRLDQIKEAIKDQDRDSVVKFEGQDLVVSFAIYLIEFVETKFGQRNTEGL